MEEINKGTDFDFFAFPLDVLVDLINLIDRATIVQISGLNKRFKNEFDKDDGLWQRLTLKIFGWTTQGINFYYLRVAYLSIELQTTRLKQQNNTHIIKYNYGRD
jgi:hypothetical protein